MRYEVEIPALKMPLVDGRVQRVAGGRDQQFAGRPERTLAVRMGAQPGEERLEIALGDGRQNGRIGTRRRIEKLRRRHGAQRVGREVTPSAARPVDVLQAAILVIVRRDADEFLHAVAPRAGQIGEIEIAGDQRLLQSVAQNHVRGVRRFVGIDAN